MDTVEVHGHSLDENVHLSQIAPEDLQHVWRLVYPHFIYGRAHLEEWTKLEDIYSEVYSGEKQLWMGSQGNAAVFSIITRLIAIPKGRVVQILWTGGEGLLEYLPYVMDWLELWAHRNKCVSVEILGRKGWIRALKPMGYSPSAVLVTKDITNMREM